VEDRQFHQPLGEDADIFRLQVEDFANAIRTGQVPRGATAVDGVASVRGMVAIARAVRSGDWVRLAEVDGGL
jgi:predicted dehydrogenase